MATRFEQRSPGRARLASLQALSPSRAAGALLLAGLAIALAIYWPGLGGGFLFDDFPNIVDNEAVHVTSGTWQNWLAAAQGSPSSLARPLAMVSFGVNYYFAGLDPSWYKLTNVAIHLINGALVFLMLRTLIGLWRRRELRVSPALAGGGGDLFAAAIACAWLFAPINLSAVLYVVQRMTEMGGLFVLLALLAYVHGRGRQLAGRRGWPWLALGLVALPAAGVSGKETAVLVPAYALAIELALLGFVTTCADTGRTTRDQRLIAAFALLIATPVAYFLYQRLPGLVSGAAFSGRDFTLGERLLTEARVLVDYVYWTVLPWLGNLSFYHDDVRLSTGVFSPPATAACIAALAALLALALAALRRAPLVALGLLWFFAGHVLTATVIPLELVFEHRNYFASLGLLLAVGALLVRCVSVDGLRLPAYVVLGALVVWPATVTAMRALEWSSPLRLAASEAQTHPRSPRAQYALGRALLIRGGDHPRPAIVARARRALVTAKDLPGASVTPDLMLIVMAGRTRAELDPGWYQSAIDKLHNRPIRAEGVSALQSLVRCQIEGPCAAKPRATLALFLAALKQNPHSARLLSPYSQFAAFELGDAALARRTARAALGYSKFPALTRAALANILGGEPGASGARR